MDGADSDIVSTIVATTAERGLCFERLRCPPAEMGVEADMVSFHAFSEVTAEALAEGFKGGGRGETGGFWREYEEDCDGGIGDWRRRHHVI